MILEMKNPEKASALFGDWEETLIWSCLQQLMGKVYGNDTENPTSAMAVLADFCFFAGEVDKELVCYKPEWFQSDFIIMVPQYKAWAEVIKEVYGDKAKQVTRYAFTKEKDFFDRDRLQNIVDNLGSSYELRLIDEAVFQQCRMQGWANDFVSQYADYEKYKQLGLGAAILKDGEIVAGASSYTRYKDGIEIEIDTREDCRRKGLATICGAKLILECLDRGLYPSWDAQNLWSKALAEKLGYHFSHEYEAYEIWGY